MRVAIVRLSSLGDVIVSATLLPYMRSLCEGAWIEWYVDRLFAEVLQDSPCVDKLWILNLKKGGVGALGGIIKTLRAQGRYDVVIDMQGLLKSAIVGALLKKGAFWGFGRDSIKEPAASVFYHHRVQIPYEAHILERNLKLTESALGREYRLEGGGYGLEEGAHIASHAAYQHRALAFGASQAAREKISALLGGICPRQGGEGCGEAMPQGARFVAFVLEASLESKCYPLDLCERAIKNLLDSESSVYVLLLQHSSQKAEALKARFMDTPQVVALPRLSLDEVKALWQRVSVVVGGDTGLTHLAWAMGRGSLTLYGNTPAERFALLGECNLALSGSEEASYQKDDFSIAQIQPECVAGSVGQILKKSSSKGYAGGFGTEGFGMEGFGMEGSR